MNKLTYHSPLLEIIIIENEDVMSASQEDSLTDKDFGDPGIVPTGNYTSSWKINSFSE